MKEIMYRKVPMMMHAIDKEGRLIDVNDEWCMVMEYQREEVIGKKSIEFLTQASRNMAIRSILPYFFEHGECRNVPYQFVKKSGAILEVELSAHSIRDEAGTIIESRAVLVDVTDRNRILRQVFAQNPTLAEEFSYIHLFKTRSR